ncbi:MAG: 2-oxoacid:acceptor oxidoreductase subunit alpha [Nanoarchaeota archaeon]|nr:2-oxoacid:acceptor oxidoreductase subunit alpha [Nanoarchaeota archaeon]
MNNKLSWMMGGEAGFGIVNAGVVFSRTCSRGGLHVFDRVSYPSLIKGDHNNLHVRVEDEPIYAHVRPIDILVALNNDTINRQKHRLQPNALVIYDGDEVKIGKDELPHQSIQLCPVSLKKIAEKNGGKIMMNTVAIGASFGLLEYPFEILSGVIKDSFGKKGGSIVDSNIAAAKEGYEFGKKNYASLSQFKLSPLKGQPKRMLITGSDALGIGAIKSGVKLVAGYPMTPGTTTMEYIATREYENKIVIKHTEDELAAFNMMCGASFAGIRAFNTTSGGGFDLMTEALSMSGMVETPVVSMIAMRGGPSTGLPTHTEQADLNMALHAGHGEFPRIVIAPGDQEECFYDTFNLFNLAEKYQVTGLILSDKHLQSSHRAIEFFDHKKLKIDRGKLLSDAEVSRNKEKRFKRFQFIDDGVSPRVVPGQKGGIHRVSTDEHDEYGEITEDQVNRVKMMEKRYKKIDTVLKEIPAPKVYGDADADLTIICWGSTKGMALEAMKWLKKDGLKVNMIHFVWMWPFPAEKVKPLFSRCKKLLLVEQNITSQLGRLIREQLLMDIPEKMLKYNGSPFYPEEIYDRAKALLR